MDILSIQCIYIYICIYTIYKQTTVSNSITYIFQVSLLSVGPKKNRKKKLCSTKKQQKKAPAIFAISSNKDLSFPKRICTWSYWAHWRVDHHRAWIRKLVHCCWGHGLTQVFGKTPPLLSYGKMKRCNVLFLGREEDEARMVVDSILVNWKGFLIETGLRV